MPKPNYSLCTDRFDNVQLTDGKTYGSSWFHKSTVGWNSMSKAPEVTIDLKKKAYISKVKVHSIGGGAALVEYPQFIAILVSEDGRSFGLVRLMECDDLPRGRNGRIPHTFVLEDLGAEGRFVKVLMQPGRSKHLFLDEVEVIGQVGPALKSTTQPGRLRQFSDSGELISAIEKQLQLKEKIAATIETVGLHRGKLGVDFCESVLSELQELVEHFAPPINELFSADKLLGFNKDVGVIRAKIYRQIYKKPYACVPANPIEVLNEKDMPIAGEVVDLGLNVEFWQGEYESAAINIKNCTDKTMSVYVSVSPLTGPEDVTIDSKETFTIRRAVFVSAAWVGSIADALVLQNEKPFELEAGCVAQIWLTIFNPGLTAGDYKGSVAVTAVSEGKKLPIETLPININVAEIKFPQTVALNSCVWAYPEIAAETKNSLAEAAQDLNKHYMNAVVAHGNRSLPFPKKQQVGGRSVVKVDYSNHDRFLQMNNYARTYLFFFNFNWKNRHELFGEWMTPGWKKNFSSWLREWVEHLKGTGIGYEKFAMYPFDETLGDEFYELARLIKHIDPRIRIYANSFGKGPRDFMRFKNVIDIWCLQDSHCVRHPDWLALIKGFGTEVWTYGPKGPGKANHPYIYYRLMPWRAFKRGQTGAGFWTYVDYYKKQGWDDTGTPFGYYGVIYGSHIQSAVDTLGEDIVPSRRWEAWREGIEDYQYLYELKKAIDLTKDSDSQKAKEAKQILDTQVDYVLRQPDNCDAVYRSRRNITAALLKLTEQ
ncbi:MAG: hypothetical protein ACYS32_03045 [Planctomycetota bacterium]